MTTSEALLEFVNIKWHKAHKLAMFAHYMDKGEVEQAMTQQFLYLAAQDEESKYWRYMNSEQGGDLYYAYLTLLETIIGESDE